MHREIQEPMSRKVYDALLSRFISENLEPGSKVTIDLLAREFSVSPTPVREALARLETNGLVVRQLNSGYRIASKMSRSQFEDLVEIRAALEPAAAALAARKMSTQKFDHLQSNAERMAQNSAGGPDSYATFALADAEFHDAIASASENQLIRDTLARLGIHVRLFRLRNHSSIRTDAIFEHQAILDALKSGDPELSAYKMTEHILHSAERFRTSFDSQPGYTGEPIGAILHN